MCFAARNTWRLVTNNLYYCILRTIRYSLFKTEINYGAYKSRVLTGRAVTARARACMCLQCCASHNHGLSACRVTWLEHNQLFRSWAIIMGCAAACRVTYTPARNNVYHVSPSDPQKLETINWVVLDKLASQVQSGLLFCERSTKVDRVIDA